MTQERLQQAKEAFAKVQNLLKEAGHPEDMLNRFHNSVYCFDSIPDVEYWINVDDIISVQIFNDYNDGDDEWFINPNIEIIDPDTDDWDGVKYNVNEL